MPKNQAHGNFLFQCGLLEIMTVMCPPPSPKEWHHWLSVVRGLGHRVARCFEHENTFFFFLQILEVSGVVLHMPCGDLATLNLKCWQFQRCMCGAVLTTWPFALWVDSLATDSVVPFPISGEPVEWLHLEIPCTIPQMISWPWSRLPATRVRRRWAYLKRHVLQCYTCTWLTCCVVGCHSLRWILPFQTTLGPEGVHNSEIMPITQNTM